MPKGFVPCSVHIQKNLRISYFADITPISNTFLAILAFHFTFSFHPFKSTFEKLNGTCSSEKNFIQLYLFCSDKLNELKKLRYFNIDCFPYYYHKFYTKAIICTITSIRYTYYATTHVG